MFISRPYDGHVYVVEFPRSGAGRANGLRWSRVTIEPIADGERRIDAGIVPKCIRRACRRISSATLGKKAHFCDRHHIAGGGASSSNRRPVPHMRCSPSMVFLPTQPRQRGASLLGGDREHSGRRGDHPANGWAMGGDRGMVMSNVVSLQLARERARQPRGGSKRLALPLWNSEITRFDGRRSLERLEAENAQLRRSVVELVLELQALHDGAGTIRAYDAARHRPDVP
jgi:hypothetical protein